MPWYVYVLKSEKDGKRYFGCTQDITKRLARHQKGQVRASKNRGPFSLLHVEEFDTRAAAFARERFFKSWAGRIELAKILGAKGRG